MQRKYNVAMKYGGPMRMDNEKKIEKEVGEVIEDIEHHYKVKLIGKLMRKILKLGTASGIDANYKKAINDMSAALAEEMIVGKDK
jgi:hypothetical protein